MKYWVAMCLGVGLVLGDECIGWVCLLLAVMPPVVKLGFRWSQLMQSENRRSTPAIDDEGFYI